MFVDTETTDSPNRNSSRPTPDQLLRMVDESERAKLRVYIGAAAGVGKTYRMLQDAHQLRDQGIDVVIAVVETHGRFETEEQIKDLEQIPLRRVEYKGSKFDEMDLEAVIERRPAVAIVDELAHSNIPGSKHAKRYEDVLELVENGISVITAVNIQHIESLNDVISRTTGVMVRETIPDSFFKRADEIIDVDVSIDTLRTRLRQGKVYSIEKIEQALNNFFRKGNLAALRELALRQVALHQSVQDHAYREREGLEQFVVPEKVMVCMASRGSAAKLLRTGARIVGRHAYKDWYAVYVETPDEEPGRIAPATYAVLQENIKLASSLGAEVVRLKGTNVADELLQFAREHEVTHVIFGQSARSRWEIIWKGSVINRFLKEVRDAAVHVVPLDDNGN
ncbi:MAG: histidine kinase [Blastocatellia bacterium]|nr:histidine kinase [Chloracidobacterium sp.]MBL8184359.1 histidine kinase [Blastocatellia bacterium]HRJ89782.1 sensor histidine kinase KdpD [Pyrinomonadaceae bacterium]